MPLRVDDAAEMAALLDDARLHEHTGGRPATLGELRARYGRSRDREQGWLNWAVRRRDTGAIAGTVQATLDLDGGRLSATLAWVVVPDQQGNGYAGEAAQGMVAWLRLQGVELLVANIHPGHRASIGVARRLGLTEGAAHGDGEFRWAADLATPPAG